MKPTLLDCTFRDGGYYNNWDFPAEIWGPYFHSMEAAGIDYVEVGLRSLEGGGAFKGPFAFSRDEFIAALDIPASLRVGVMVNAAELVKHADGVVEAARQLFAERDKSPVELVRVACHVHEVEFALPACDWLKSVGYRVGLNLMQVADRSDQEIRSIAELVSRSKVDVLYFADSLGSLQPADCSRIIDLLRAHWQGEIGIHTHDNMGRAVANTIQALDDGVTWLDSTVTGMGRGPGNAQTEYLVVELDERRGTQANVAPLLRLIREFFQPMKQQYGWGSNLFYYLAGRHGIHPSFVQEMLSDCRYGDEDILAAIAHLRDQGGGKKFSVAALNAARHMTAGSGEGVWQPRSIISGREVLIVGTGPGVTRHRAAIESYIRRSRPFVLGLNAVASLSDGLIEMRAACHPVRLLADLVHHTRQQEALVAPGSMFASFTPNMGKKQLLDFEVSIAPGTFEFSETRAVIPSPLTLAYALAVATSGDASRILLAGFDGYGAGDPRMKEIRDVFMSYSEHPQAREVISITPTAHDIRSTSVYAM